MRIGQLNEYERNVILMIDEIYIKQKLDYNNGMVQGLTTEGDVATTLLCFMVKSITGKYEDIIGIYPMYKANAHKQFLCFQEVQAFLRNFTVYLIAICVDNAAINRKFYKNYLCKGEIKMMKLQKSLFTCCSIQCIFLKTYIITSRKGKFMSYHKCLEISINISLLILTYFRIISFRKFLFH